MKEKMIKDQTNPSIHSDKTAMFLAEVRADAAERKTNRVSIEEFLEAADTLLDLWRRHNSSTGLTALFCVCWALNPTHFNFPVTRLYAFDHERSLAWVRLMNGVMLGHGDYNERLELHLGGDRVQQLRVVFPH